MKRAKSWTRLLSAVIGLPMLVGSATAGITTPVMASACCCDLSCMSWCQYPRTNCNPEATPLQCSTLSCCSAGCS